MRNSIRRGLPSLTLLTIFATFCVSAAAQGYWESRAPIPESRAEGSGATYAGKFYIFGGSNVSTPTNIPEVYDPATNSWSTKAPDPITRGMAAAITVGNTIYVAGGWINNDSNTPTPAVSAYNPIANTWTSVSNMPRSRGEMAYGYINGKIYFTGGGASFPNVNAQTDIWDLYDQYVDVGRGHALSC